MIIKCFVLNDQSCKKCELAFLDMAFSQTFCCKKIIQVSVIGPNKWLLPPWSGLFSDISTTSSMWFLLFCPMMTCCMIFLTLMQASSVESNFTQIGRYSKNHHCFNTPKKYLGTLLHLGKFFAHSADILISSHLKSIFSFGIFNVVFCCFTESVT